MTQGLTLCEFLENTGARLRIYDMGRRIVEIPRDDFLAFENTAVPYPLPMQQKAWVALVQEHESNGEPLIWFLRFELDEQSKLVLATRDYFIHRFVELAAGDEEKDLGAALEDNPFIFKPREDKLANLNAILNRDLGRPPSQYFEHARDYFAGKLGWDQWNFVGYQGIADLAARKSEPHICRLLAESLQHLPDEPLIALCQCLENHVVRETLGAALCTRLEVALDVKRTSRPVLAALLRALSRAESALAQEAVLAVLSHPASADPEVIAAIGGRAWEALQDPVVARTYLERLASDAVGQEMFDHCVGDLLRLPGMKPHILGILRSGQRSEQLAGAFQAMLGTP